MLVVKLMDKIRNTELRSRTKDSEYVLGTWVLKKLRSNVTGLDTSAASLQSLERNLLPAGFQILKGELADRNGDDETNWTITQA